MTLIDFNPSMKKLLLPILISIVFLAGCGGSEGGGGSSNPESEVTKVAWGEDTWGSLAWGPSSSTSDSLWGSNNWNSKNWQ